MERLAIHGGRPVRTRPFPNRKPFGPRERAFVLEALRRQNLFSRPGYFAPKLEKAFARTYKVKYAVTATSGTAAIHLAVGAVNPEPGDEIITAPITDFGTVSPILQQTAIPIFADVDPRSMNMLPEEVERKITRRTRAIIVVHLFGNPCDMDAMVRVARRHGVMLIEDCSQAHYTRYKGKLLGTIGDIGCFSFQQSKHMTCGDGGMAITNNKRLAHRMKLFSDKGWNYSRWGRRAYRFLAPNYRITELQSAVALAQLGKVRSVTRRRKMLGDYLSRLIRDVDGVLPAAVTEGGEHTYWLYPLQITRGSVDAFAKAMQAEGVWGWAHYIRRPIFLCAATLTEKATFGRSKFPFDSPYTTRKIEYDASMCPGAQAGLDRVITIPLHEDYSRKDIEDIAAAIRKVAYWRDRGGLAPRRRSRRKARR